MTVHVPTESARAEAVTRRLMAILDQSPEARRLRDGRELASVRRSAGKYSSSFAIEDVELVFADGSVVSLVLKDLGPPALLAEAARVKPVFLFDPRREIETYRHVLGPHDLGAPAMVGAAIDEAAQSYLLLLEKVWGVPLWQVGDFEAWRAAARWQAAVHARFTGEAGATVPGKARLLRYDAAYYARWHDRARAALASSPTPRDADRLLSTYEAAVPRLLALPLTFIHGEFHASNVLVESLPGGVRIRPVDWELAGLAPGLMDLADLTAGKWTPRQRDLLVDTYREELFARGAPPADEFDVALDECRLHRAMQWLSWSADWSPPREHAQDWSGEALRICDSLDVRRVRGVRT
jgi:hypothetical protein